ncbi:MAG TPA: efflux RND transporter permease subunit, partial [Phycisphaerae bacterium]
LVADQDISSEAMTKLTKTYAAILGADPAVEAVISFNGGRGTANTATMFITLKPQNVRKMPSEQVIARLRPKLSGIAGGILRLTSVQDVRAGGRQSNGGLYQYALQGDTLGELSEWAPKVMEKVRTLPGIVDLNSDQQTHGIQAVLEIDRATAARMDISTQAIDDALYDAFGQRQVSTMYAALNQYHVVMEAAPGFTTGPKDLEHIYVRTSSGMPIPLSTVAHYTETSTSLSIPHQSQFPCITLSFNLKVGTSLSDAVREITEAEQQMGVPATIHGSFAGTAQVFQESSASLPYLIVAAIVAVYIVLGMLYESFIHPITILSTLPSAGVGALLALLLFHIDLSIIAFIGILLLIGIVKKNAIMMIDFAIAAERHENKSPRDAIFQAAVLRFRPITMTTMAAMLGGLPLAIGAGVGGELRQPLGVTIVGGLLFSQALTLYTTPVIYLYLDRLRLVLADYRKGLRHSIQESWQRRPAFPMILILGLLSLGTGMLVSCKVGADYQRPNMDVPATYKSATTEDAATEPAHLITNWWVLFQDPDLNKLEEDALRNNPDLKAALERVAQARAAARQVKSQFYPQITLDPELTGQYSGKTGVTSPTRIPFDLGYEVDLWGQVARSLESADANTRSTADQFAVVMQTLEADIAQDYINLRALEAQDDILTENVKLTQEQLDLINRKLGVGLVGGIDVAQAQTEIDELKTQQIDIHRQRTDIQHALAILTGKAPADFSVDTKPRVLATPNIPPGLPAELLRHRPDVASAEQNLIAANAQVAVALADFYPAVRLTGVAGYESVDVQHIFDWQSALLSLGPSVSLPIFEGGRLEGALDQSKARYEELRATYRSTLLAAFRDVEVSLTDVHMRADALEAQHRAVESAREYLRLSKIEYDQGLESYLQLLDADRTLLTNEQTESQLLDDRLVSTVLLIKAMGGGWSPERPTSRPVDMPAEE